MSWISSVAIRYPIKTLKGRKALAGLWLFQQMPYCFDTLVSQNHQVWKQNHVPQDDQESWMGWGRRGEAVSYKAELFASGWPRELDEMGEEEGVRYKINHLKAFWQGSYHFSKVLLPKFPSLLNKLPNYESFNSNLLMGSKPHYPIRSPEDFFWTLLHWKWGFNTWVLGTHFR